MKIPRFLRFLCCFSALIVVHAAGGEVPSDQAGFRQRVQELFQKHLPEFIFELREPLILTGAGPNGETTGDISLERIYGYCAANPHLAESAVAHFVNAAMEVINPAPITLRPDMIRLVVRREAYVKDAIANMGPGPRAAFFQPIAADLVLVPVIDLPNSLRYLGDKDLMELNMTDEQAFEVGRKNFKKGSKPLSKVARVPPKRGLGYIQEEYAPSRLAFHDEWASLAKKLKGKLVVMVPASDLLMFVQGVDRISWMHCIQSDWRPAEKPIAPCQIPC